MSSSSEGTSQSAPESPVIGLIEIPAASLPSTGTAEKPREPTLEAPEHTPAAAEGASNAGGVAEPPELSQLKCAGYHHKGNTDSYALQTEQFLVCRVTSR